MLIVNNRGKVLEMFSWPFFKGINGTCITIKRSITRINEARKALDSSFVGIKSLLISSQLR